MYRPIGKALPNTVLGLGRLGISPLYQSQTPRILSTIPAKSLHFLYGEGMLSWPSTKGLSAFGDPRRKVRDVLRVLTPWIIAPAPVPAGDQSGTDARDRAELKDVPPAIREWFESKVSPSGIPCCSYADGHPSDDTASDDTADNGKQRY
jgi:hypothetical protein